MDERLQERLTEPAALGVRRVALEMVAAIEDANSRRGEGDDSEALHDMRVAMRRLRSWLRAMDDSLQDIGRKTRQRLEEIAAASNASRDAEVLLNWLQERVSALAPRERAAARHLVSVLTERKAKADAELQREIDKKLDRTLRTLRRRLSRHAVPVNPADVASDPTFGMVLSHAILTQEAALADALADIRSVVDDERIHRARIRGKRLRYVLEPIMDVSDEGRTLIQRLKKLQDALGEVHNAHFWSRELAKTMEDAAHEDAEAIAAIARADSPPPRKKGGRRRTTTRLRPGLVALAEGVRAHAEEAYSRAQAEWLGDAADDFLGRTRALVGQLKSGSRQGMEFERKYLLSGLPPQMPAAETHEIAQGYLPGQRLVERLRRDRSNGSERFLRTVKSGAGVARLELEEETTRDIFEHLWPLTKGKRLEKRRHVVADGEQRWEIDEFLDRPLIVAEVELPSADTAVSIPEWLAPAVEREVTGEREYLNVNLAR
ncbi:MAG TPA: CHAD domain-containing protein [Gemmatimonadaceae bacterium]|nr:CHAD domain-containing protein [Gemmatimonadaceae bacterium]